MLYEFRSRATGSITMTGDVGKRILAVIGKAPDAQGIITVAQMPAAIAALEAEIGREKAAAAVPADDDNDEAAQGEPNPIGLGQRAFPLIEMLKRSHAADKDITWGV